jgi:hypothetical protein
MAGCQDDDESGPPPPSKEEVTAFEAEQAAGPSFERFVVDVAGTGRSRWNKKIAAIFVEDFIASPNNEWNKTHRKIVQQQAKSHIRYLCQKFGRRVGRIGKNISAEQRLRIAAQRHRRREVSGSIQCI